jgi:hypothetical protein
MVELGWPLADGVHAACCGEDLVLLDVRSDRYFCLPQAGAGVRIDIVRGRLSGLDEGLAGELLDEQLLSRSSLPGCRRAPPRALAELSWPTDREALSMTTGAQLLAANVAMSWRFRGRTFSALVEQVRRHRVPAAAPTTEVISSAQAFRAALPWFPVQGACLYQSFLLLDLLRRRGLAADWVFGVMTR